MKPDSDDNQYYQLFRELRLDDEHAAPQFAVTWQAATARATGRRHGPRSWRLAITTAALVVVGIGVTLLFDRPGAASVQSAVAPSAVLITQWESPTDFLLTAASTAESAQSTTQSNQ
ncbi:MAG: hypothetical protein NT154_43780 [Verrucomicrobia bacterium]|nr:hypothetical protein [Verrucomicrobiota bacterium]